MPEQTEAEKEAAEAVATAEKKAAEEAAAAEKPKGKDGTDYDPDRAQRALEAARAGEKKAKDEAKELREAKKELDEIKAAQLTEQEKLAKQAEDAIAKAADADAKLRRANLIAELAKPEHGIVNATAAAKLIEGVEFDDEGAPTNLGSPDEEGSLLASFLKENDYLRGKAAKPTPPSLDGPEGGDETQPELTAEELAAAKKYGMEPKEYAAFQKGGSIAELKESGVLNT